MGFSIASVCIENEEEYEKQDCELKAFYRLSEILKARFPRLLMCLLFNRLYPNKNVLEICKTNEWGYYITLKRGSCSKLYDGAMEQIRKILNDHWITKLKLDCIRIFHGLKILNTVERDKTNTGGN
jgi:hypothetical protein